MMKIYIGYPKEEEEIGIVKNMLEGKSAKQIESVIDKEELLQMQKDVETVIIQDNLIAYATECVRKTRNHEKVLLGASPRALLAWIKASKAYAFVEGREYVTPDDLKLLAPIVLAHRLSMVQSIHDDAGAEEVIREILRKVRVPLER